MKEGGNEMIDAKTLENIKSRLNDTQKFVDGRKLWFRPDTKKRVAFGFNGCPCWGYVALPSNITCESKEELAKSVLNILGPYNYFLQATPLLIELIEKQAAEIERLNNGLRYEQHYLSRVGTHSKGCYKWGPGHYECAMAEIERLRAENELEVKV